MRCRIRRSGHLSRVATGRNEAELLRFALSSTAAQVETYCRRLRNDDADASEIDARRLHESRSLLRHFRGDGSGSLTVELPRAELEVVLEALESVAAGLPDDPTRSLFAKGADALVAMARQALAGCATGARTDSHQVIVHVDAEALGGRGGQADLPLPAVKRLICDGAVVPLMDGSNGTPLSVGRKQRTVPTALKRSLVARDHSCVFPGCHHTRYVEAHHVQHWADGGETSLDNLLLLCSHHHTLIHEDGFTVRRHVDGRCYFARPDGRPVEIASRPADRVEESRPLYLVASLPRKMGQANLPRKMERCSDSAALETRRMAVT